MLAIFSLVNNTLTKYQMWALPQASQGSPALGLHPGWLHSDPGLMAGPLPAPCRSARTASGTPLASGSAAWGVGGV